MPDSHPVNDLLTTAMAHHAARELDRAEALYQKILKSDSHDIDALNLLGVVLQDRGLALESVALINRAIEIDPAFAEAHANLARGLMALGQSAEAVIAARRSTELDPEMAEAWLQLGFALLALSQYREAFDALNKAALRFPDAPDLWSAIGSAAQRLHDHAGAAKAWRNVLRVQPHDVDALVNLGAALGNMKQLDEALALHRRAAELAPGNRFAKAALAITLHRRLDAPELLRVARELVSGEPERLDFWILLGTALTWLGQFDQAEDAFQRVLAVRPDDADALRHLAALSNGVMAAEDIDGLRARFADPRVAVSDRIATGFVVARALDRGGDPDGAFSAYLAANRLRHGELKAANDGFDPKQLRDYADWATAVLTPGVFLELQPWGNPSEVPVFIVGMPRSGTSLVEQIAASHPRVHGAGERNDMINLLSWVSRGQPDLPPAMWDRTLMARETARHIARLKTLGAGADRVTDKLPNNIHYLGQISLLFPNAKLIVCRRDLRDVCVSCFTTQFRDSVSWSYDLEECAVRALQTERLADHWCAAMPGRVLEVHYETLVNNLEAESRRLIDFLGLDWDPACLDFHKTERAVTTASFWQVRQPLYDSSIGRWRRYEAHLGPMLKILAERTG